MSVRRTIAVLLLVALHSALPSFADPPSKADVVTAMRRAATFYRERVASHGGYVYYYSVDLEDRFGEGRATKDQIWVQPPGTPTVGLAYLAAFEATGDRFHLDAAREAASALIHGQLKSGAWTNAVDFDPRGSRVAAYRNGRGRGRNFSTLDDGISQSAIRFLVETDAALDFEDERIHEAVGVALKALLAAQFPNGGFPQGWDDVAVPNWPIVKASFPNYDWRTEGRIKEYWDRYTLNDGVAGEVAETLIVAETVYGDAEYRRALESLGDFLMLAQMPDPQPAWAQQYNRDMHPIWARRFEPPAISGWESQDAIATLLRIARHTGNAKYLKPIPRAIAYLKKSRLADGRLARYYELESNRPLYMTRRGKQYTLTYSDKGLPDHYGWKMPSRLAELEAELERVKNGAARPRASRSSLEKRAMRVLAELDDEGRWISTFSDQRLPGDQKFRPGDRFIGSDVFSENLTTLAESIR